MDTLSVVLSWLSALKCLIRWCLCFFFSRFFVEYVENGEIIHDGLLKGLGDTGAGVLALILLGEPSWGAGAGTKNKGTQRRY